MKKIYIIAAPLLLSSLFIGYYETCWIEDNQIRFFIKKSPTLQISFVNVFASDHEDNWHGQLEKKERQYAIDFCKYYLGVETEMKTMKDFEDCREVYIAARDRPAT
jgi:hypothetical protein